MPDLFRNFQKSNGRKEPWMPKIPNKMRLLPEYIYSKKRVGMTPQSERDIPERTDGSSLTRRSVRTCRRNQHPG